MKIPVNLRLCLLLAMMVCSVLLKAQDLAAYSDYKNYFFGFSKGKKTELEYMPVKSFKIGGNTIAYIDNMGNLKVFYNDKVTKLSDGAITKYMASDYLLTYSINKSVSVFDNGTDRFLTSFAESYATGDSMVSFYDSRKYTYNMYYRGKVTTIEENISRAPVKSFKMGDNIFAYINYLDQFKVFYRGNSYKLMNTLNRVLPYEAGKNIVGYFNDNYGFSAFYNGATYDLETFQPKSFSAGDDVLAYVSVNGQFKIFYDGQTQLINSFEPDFYKVKDSLVVYNEAKKFKVFYRGTSYVIEEYIPKNYQFEFNTVVYTDQEGRLKCFSKGQPSFITNSSVDEFKLFRNVIWYRVLNDNFIYYQSKIYPQ